MAPQRLLQRLLSWNSPGPVEPLSPAVWAEAGSYGAETEALHDSPETRVSEPQFPCLPSCRVLPRAAGARLRQWGCAGGLGALGPLRGVC